jgi:hypothetical protein
MTTGDPRADVNRRAAAIFANIDDYQEQVFLAEINALAAELPADDPDGLFHRAYHYGKGTPGCCR